MRLFLLLPPRCRKGGSHGGSQDDAAPNIGPRAGRRRHAAGPAQQLAQNRLELNHQAHEQGRHVLERGIESLRWLLCVCVCV